MSVLFLANDRLTHDLLRGWLSRLGLGPILSARTADEAWYHVRSRGSSLRFILAEEWRSASETARFRDLVEKDETLNRVPFLVIDSNPSFSRSRSLGRLARVDGVLKKPFDGSGLFDAMTKASEKRQSARSLVVVFEEGPRFDCGILLKERLKPHFLWREVVSVSTLSDLASITAARSKELGVVLLESDAYKRALVRKEPDWLSRFRRSRASRGVPCVALVRSPEVPKSFRTSCSHFARVPDAPQSAEALIRTLDRSVRHQFAVRVYLALSRRQLQAGRPELAARNARTAQKLDETRGEALALLGESRLATGDLESAEALFRASLQLNPYRPHAHMRLLDLTRRRSPGWEPIQQQATLFCPEHSGVRRAVTLLAGSR